MTTTKDLAYYLSLPYTMVLKRDEEGDYVGKIEELDGCIAHGSNEAEAIENLRAMQALWIQDCLESEDKIPEPAIEEPLPSGKWVQRVPRTLHQRLTLMAKREEVSLNQLVTSMLTEALVAKTMNRAPSMQVGQVTFPYAPVASFIHHGSPWDCFKQMPGNRSDIKTAAFPGRLMESLNTLKMITEHSFESHKHVPSHNQKALTAGSK